ncbi:hypothetical protein EXIGLDRAFT_716777 [Exidia glandulosa HHB12029]|uniref:Zn(2)-C6 fungal-type domain-containing protein n=1 Tax=Exidia glandulosa HHB12029 TaxID=1314781 RepID=A0A165IS28_EXIGL|nr:hypothetical protein EXIGLDRAFT_716777 [Exidia glandulosa HHB12029]
MDNPMLAHSSLSPADLVMTDDKKLALQGQPGKPAKALNRVPRACNACRKQKMRCINAEDPPCKRCRTAGIECLFEKPSREATLTGEAGLERIRNLESQVADIRHSQHAIQSTLVDLVSQLRQPGLPHSSPGFYGAATQSPGMRQGHMSLDPAALALNGHQPQIDPSLQNVGGPGMLPSLVRGPGQAMGPRPSREDVAYSSPGGGNGAVYSNGGGAASHTQLPPISTIHDGMPPPPPRTAGPGVAPQQQAPQGQKRIKKARSSAFTSNEDSEDEGEGKTGIPASGLVAPWEVLRGLAEAAAERAAKENGGPEINSTEPPSRLSRSPGPLSPDKGERPAKRRKVAHGPVRPQNWPDVVTKRLISEQEARELFKIFYEGCSTFLPVFDARVDTYDALRERSPFAVDCICMVAAKVRDGGGPPSEMYTKILEEVHNICSKTLFAPVARKEVVQSMILVSGWSDNGWLSGGHAVRMALELGMHKAWPKLLKRMKAGKNAPSNEERELVISTRTWFCLYLFEHQMSFGTGRPAILREDDGIIDCRYLLQHPLSIEDDTRLVSTVELMIYRERVHNSLSILDPLSDQTFQVLRDAEATFRAWFDTWDARLAKHYGDSNFYRQSLQIQQYYALLFHHATVLRGIKGPEDAARMPAAQRAAALHSMELARKGLNICLRYPSYREGLKYAVHYTHMSATFAASFLLRLARLFPEECDLQGIMDDVEELASVLSKIPAGRYARTLRIMLHAHRKRRNASQSPEMTMDRNRPVITVRPPSSDVGMAGVMPDGGAPAVHTPDGSYAGHPLSAGGIASTSAAGGFPLHETGNYDYYMRNFDTQNNEVPLWLSEHNLGDTALSSHGLEAFILPLEFDQRATVPQIW